ncbi:3-hydroxyacyl-CoA dehydrogenase [Methylibium sp.]|uniref:3-hydroxyacyl-CoA dehydrogenase n=1 Tax=Methylibium sp. TaxID=2067992 RepID=UPI003D0EE275
MTRPLDERSPVFVIGAGIMGAGIAQVAAQAGHPVQLYDAREGAAADAKRKLAASLDALVMKGRVAPEFAQATVARITPATAIDDAAGAHLVVEAIVEQAETKRALFAQLEAVVDADCVLASNTSSISITALARDLQRPGRFVGMHFFNPVPLMKLVEVVSGLQTEPAVAQAIFGLAERWSKTPVHARSTPGFIVNRIARPYYAETLALLQERAAEPAVLDACLRGAGFRMGPCELMDLIGHDTNFAVTASVHEANFGDRRFVPSLVQRELVDGGLLGRKSGRGFYVHAERTTTSLATPSAASAVALPSAARWRVHGHGALVERWLEGLARDGRAFDRVEDSAWSGLELDGAQLRQTDGRPAAQVAAETAVRDVALFDRAGTTEAAGTGSTLAWSASGGASEAWQARAAQCLQAAGWQPQRLRDVPGLVVARTLAMLINEASDAVLQGVCSAPDADLAMKLGVNYPAGPFEWLARWDARQVVALLDRLDAHYRGERYRASPALREQAWLQEARTT